MQLELGTPLIQRLALRRLHTRINAEKGLNRGDYWLLEAFYLFPSMKYREYDKKLHLGNSTKLNASRDKLVQLHYIGLVEKTRYHQSSVKRYAITYGGEEVLRKCLKWYEEELKKVMPVTPVKSLEQWRKKWK